MATFKLFRKSTGYIFGKIDQIFIYTINSIFAGKIEFSFSNH